MKKSDFPKFPKFQGLVGAAAVFAGVSAHAGTVYERHFTKEIFPEIAEANKIRTGYFIDDGAGTVVIHTVFRRVETEGPEKTSVYLGSTQTEVPGLALSESKNEIQFSHEGHTVSCARVTKKKSLYGMAAVITPTGACTLSSEIIRGGARHGDLDVGFKAEF